MIRVFDFVCDAGHRTEHFVTADTATQICPTCSGVSHKALSAPPFILDGASGHFPGKAMKWEREHEKAGRGSHFKEEQ